MARRKNLVAEPPHQDGKKSLATRIATGAAWIVAGRLLMRMMGFINLAILGRLLTPADYDYIAVVFSVMLVLQGMTEFGAAQAVVKFRDASKADYDTLFTLSFIRGVFLALVLLGLAVPLANFYGDKAYIALFCVVAIVPFLEGLFNPRFFEFERNINFIQELKVLASRQLLAVIVSVTIALLTRSYWAMIAGHIVGTLAQLILTYVMVSYKPKFSLSEQAKVLGFSGWVAAVGFVSTMNLKMDSLFLAKIFGKGDVGPYWMGVQLSQLLTNEVANPVGRALFPGMSEMQDNTEGLRKVCLGGGQALGAIVLPLAFGLSFVAEDLITLILGDPEKWHQTVPVVQFVAPTLGIYFITSPIYQYVMAQGQTRLLFFRELLYFIVRVPLFIWAAIAYGFMGAVYMRAAAGLVQMTLNMGIYKKLSGRSFFEPVLVAWRSLAAVAVMSVWFLLLRPHLDMIEALPLLVRLGIDAACGAVLYIGAHGIIWQLAGRPAGVEQVILSKTHPLIAKFSR